MLSDDPAIVRVRAWVRARDVRASRSGSKSCSESGSGRFLCNDS